MLRTATITEASLRSLGPKLLAAFLLETCDRDDVIDRKMRMTLAAKGGGDALDAELTERIKSLASAQVIAGWLPWRPLSRSAVTACAVRKG